MSTPPNPPSNTPGPPTEPAGTPIPEAPATPAPAQPTSLEKKTPTPAPAPAPAPSDAETPQAPADSPQAPAAAPSPAAPQAPGAPEAPAPASFGPPAPAGPAAPAAPAPSPFAPPGGASAPQAPPYGAAPGGPGVPGGPGNPWGHPGTGFNGIPYPGYAQTAPATNGLAIAALVLGILGVLAGVTPFLFWSGAILGLTGLGLGIGALVKARNGAPRKGMAIVGVVLGVLSLGATVAGFFITAAFVKEVDKQIDKEISELDIDPSGYPTYPAYPTPKPKASPSDIPGKNSALPWGGTFTYPDGVELTVQEATPYTVGKNAYPKERTGRGVKVTVKITNKSDAPIDVTTALPHARDDKGTEAEMVFDGSLPKLFKGSVMPGESATGSFLFDVANDSKSLHFEISPGLPSDYDDAIWSGPIG
ncbi:DUF4352 domain-containing protein [Streptomyces xanthophaeus]|uniref:DUF4352 domain-containing protein n=1 Tax=Streptomyces xanthophaeus TaxID=67385 RepID=UPI00372244A6